MAAKVYEFDVAMTCEGCSGAAERVLGKLGDKVTKVSIDLPGKKVFVTSSVMTADELTATLKKTGKDVSYIGCKDA